MAAASPSVSALEMCTDVVPAASLIDIAVIRLPRLSNFADFRALGAVEGVSVRYVSKVAEFCEPDLVILPGTKNTMADLLWLRQSGLEGKVLRFSHAGDLK
jgi:adenosylcobyric acid synthase